jgi:hypothetical protein
MSQTKYPANWDEQKVQRILAHYEGQAEDESVAEDEAIIQLSETAMNVPHELVPKVRGVDCEALILARCVWPGSEAALKPHLRSHP